MKNKIAIVTDSNSGITQSQAKELGVYVIPMPFDIGGTTYYEDINLTQEQFYGKLAEDVEIRTSQPSPDAVMTLWEQLLESYDELVYMPMSSGLSGSCGTAMVLAQEYDGRVQVVDNQRISVPLRQSVLDAKELAAKGKSAVQIKQVLEQTKHETSVYIMVDTLKYLKKGGRVTPAAAALGTLLRIKPVLQIHGEKLDAFAKVRTVQQAKNLMINALRNDIEKCIGKDADPSQYHLEIAHTCNWEAAQELKEQLKVAFPGCGEIYVDNLSLSVSCHTGPGALGVGFSKVIKE